MAAPARSRLPAAGPVLRALADPTRLRILRLLRHGALCVGDLVTVLGAPQPRVSRHLASLRRVRLVEDEKRGLWSFYRLTPARPGFHRKALALLDAAELPEAAADVAALRRLRARGGCCPRHQRPRRRT